MIRDARAGEQTNIPQSRKVRSRPMTFICLCLWIGAFLLGVILPVWLVGFRVSVEARVDIVKTVVPFIVVGILLMLIGIGLWRMKRWGVILLALCFLGFKVYDIIKSEPVLDMLLEILSSAILVYAIVRLWQAITLEEHITGSN
jgi:peptidoglycan/LPS O-acetylase OafA/YrhL